MRVLVLLAGLLILYLLFRWIAKQPSNVRWRYAAIAAGIGLILLVATGRLPWLFAVLGALIPIGRRLLSYVSYLPMIRQLAGQFQSAKAGAARPSQDQQSTVATEYIRMWLDHDSGAMDGEVLKGEHQGRPLRDLNLEQLLELLDVCIANDQESAALLETYIDRTHGEDWRAARAHTGEHQAATDTGTMSRKEAFDILGLSPEAGEQEIIQAHRRLIQRLHPDRGGSAYLAAKLNQAKDILL